MSRALVPALVLALVPAVLAIALSGCAGGVAGVYRYAVHLQWDRYPQPIKAVAVMEDRGVTGPMTLTAASPALDCKGTYAQSGTQSRGTWTFACADGVRASGSYELGVSSGNGVGTDHEGKRILMAFSR
ncbi:MAG: hypothetical protein JNK11_03900 [Alphaproteobacteria bacterium]|nr:hypothetical protein [Alphaproteobacteria bacterium]